MESNYKTIKSDTLLVRAVKKKLDVKSAPSSQNKEIKDQKVVKKTE